MLSSHHLLMDGWSGPVLVRELLCAVRAAMAMATALPRAVPYRDYLAFIAGQDRAASAAYWRGALAGLSERHAAGAAGCGSERVRR